MEAECIFHILTRFFYPFIFIPIFHKSTQVVTPARDARCFSHGQTYCSGGLMQQLLKFFFNRCQTFGNLLIVSRSYNSCISFSYCVFKSKTLWSLKDGDFVQALLC